jgi:2-methylisocitrate lyase-like PEP mutase family enzyme
MAGTLRELIARHHPLVVPSIYDGISALVAAGGSTLSLQESWGGIGGILGYDDFLGVPAAREKARQYGLLDD